MSKRLILILALTFVLGIAFAAYAEVQNVKVSGDITVEGVARNNIILRTDNLAPSPATTAYTQFDKDITVLLSHVRVRVDADLTDNVSTTVRLINERVWGEEGSASSDNDVSSTDVDLDLAYIHLKEFLYSPLSLTVGRQELMFGNGLIIGDVDTNGIMAGHGLVATTAGLILPKSLDDLSVRKAFDAIKATLNYDPLVIDAVYAKVDETAPDIDDDVDLYGVNANYALDKNTTIEGYYWEKKRQKATGTGGSAVLGTGQQSLNDVVRTIGTRVQYTGVKNLLLSAEGAYQFGKYIKNTALYPDELSNDRGARRRDAYAAQAISQYNLSDLDLIKNYEPVIGVSYTLLSGDPYKSSDARYRGWNPMFENQAGGTLFNKILGYSNAQLINASLSVKPIEDVKLAISYYYLRLIKPYRAYPTLPTGVNLTGVLGDPTYNMKPNKKGLGNEIDANLTYDYTEDVQLGLSLGWFTPGSAFSEPNNETASQVIGSMKVTF